MGVVKLDTKTTTNEVLAAIKAELESLKEVTGTEFKTGGSGSVQGFPNPIQKEESIDVLVKMYSSVNGKASAYGASMEAIAKDFPGFSCPVFKENGASAEALKADIILRLKILSVVERKAYLEGLLKEAQEFQTKEDRFAAWKEKVSASFGVTPPSLQIGNGE